MNVFDFDGTIHQGDSSAAFYFYNLRRHPVILLDLPVQAYAAIRYYLFNIGTKTACKEKFYTYFKRIDAVKEANRFWQKRIDHIKPFYKEIHKDSDLIISASPEFFLKPLEELLDITVMASPVSPKDGKTNGENCYHEEKVRRFKERFENAEIDDFYSDSLADEPLAKMAKRAYFVDGDKINEWDFTKHKKKLYT